MYALFSNTRCKLKRRLQGNLVHRNLTQFCARVFLAFTWWSAFGSLATYSWLIFWNVWGAQTVWTAAFITDSSASSINVDKYFPQAISFRHSTALAIRGGSKINLLRARASNTLENQSHFKAILKSPGTYSSAALAVQSMRNGLGCRYTAALNELRVQMYYVNQEMLFLALYVT